MDATRRASIGAGVEASIGLALLIWSTIATSSRAGVLPLLLLTLLLAIVGYLSVLAFNGGRPFLLHEWVPLPAEEIRLHATRGYAATGWTLNASQPASLSCSHRPPPNPLPDFLLLFFGIVPGLLYLLLGSRTQTAAVVASPAPDGTQLEIVVGFRDTGEQSSAVALFNSLHQRAAPTTPAAIEPG